MNRRDQKCERNNREVSMPTGSSPRRSAAQDPSDPVCQVCGEPIVDRKAWCVDCDTLHHGDCFAWNGRCAVYACTGMRFRREPGRDPGVQWIEIRDPGGDLVPSAFVVEFTSPRERTIFWVVYVALLAALLGLLGLLEAPGPAWSLPGWGLFGLLALIRLGLQDYRIVDAKTRKIWLHRSLYRWKRLIPETGFEDVRRVVLVGSFSHHGERTVPGYHWHVRLDLARRMDLTITDDEFGPYNVSGTDTAPPGMRETARRVAQILGVVLDVERGGRRSPTEMIAPQLPGVSFESPLRPDPEPAGPPVNRGGPPPERRGPSPEPRGRGPRKRGKKRRR